jgi:hypothetical protein
MTLFTNLLTAVLASFGALIIATLHIMPGGH